LIIHAAASSTVATAYKYRCAMVVVVVAIPAECGLDCCLEILFLGIAVEQRRSQEVKSEMPSGMPPE